MRQVAWIRGQSFKGSQRAAGYTPRPERSVRSSQSRLGLAKVGRRARGPGSAGVSAAHLEDIAGRKHCCSSNRGVRPARPHAPGTSTDLGAIQGHGTQVQEPAPFAIASTCTSKLEFIDEALYRFDLQPQVLPDYEVVSYLCSHPDSCFRSALFVARNSRALATSCWATTWVPSGARSHEAAGPGELKGAAGGAGRDLRYSPAS